MQADRSVKKNEKTGAYAARGSRRVCTLPIYMRVHAPATCNVPSTQTRDTPGPRCQWHIFALT